MSLAPLVRGRVDNGDDCGFEWRTQRRPRGDHRSQVRLKWFLNLCAYLCIAPFPLLRRMLIISNLRIFSEDFDSLHPLQ